MGFFGTFAYSHGEWAEASDVPSTSPFLRIEIHDSDIAQIDYAPTTDGHGRFYLGYEPAAYFDDPNASRPVNAAAEAREFSKWAAEVSGLHVASEEFMPLLADPDGAEPQDVFVEDTVLKLLRLAGIPAPQGFQEES